MSQPPSPSLISHPSLLDVQDDHQPYPPNPQDRNATSYSARQERLAALERRLNRSAAASPTDDTSQSRSLDVIQDPQPFDDNHEKRIEFRRLVDPGIMRPNSKEVALRSLHVNPKWFLLCELSRKEINIFFSLFLFFMYIRVASRDRFVSLFVHG